MLSLCIVLFRPVQSTGTKTINDLAKVIAFEKKLTQKLKPSASSALTFFNRHFLYTVYTIPVEQIL